MFFNSFDSLKDIVIVAVLFYISIIVMLRLSGKEHYLILMPLTLL